MDPQPTEGLPGGVESPTVSGTIPKGRRSTPRVSSWLGRSVPSTWLGRLAVPFRALWRLVVKHKQLAAVERELNEVWYPKIGKAVAATESLPEPLLLARSRVRELQQQLPVPPPESGQAGAGVVRVRLGGKLRRSIGRLVRRFSRRGDLDEQLQAAFRQLGKTSVEKYGEKAVSRSARDEFAALAARRGSLVEECSRLGKETSQAFRSRRFLASLGSVALGVAAGVFLAGRLWSGLAGLPSRDIPRADDTRRLLPNAGTKARRVSDSEVKRLWRTAEDVSRLKWTPPDGVSKFIKYGSPIDNEKALMGKSAKAGPEARQRLWAEHEKSLEKRVFFLNRPAIRMRSAIQLWMPLRCIVPDASPLTSADVVLSPAWVLLKDGTIRPVRSTGELREIERAGGVVYLPESKTGLLTIDVGQAAFLSEDDAQHPLHVRLLLSHLRVHWQLQWGFFKVDTIREERMSTTGIRGRFDVGLFNPGDQPDYFVTKQAGPLSKDEFEAPYGEVIAVQVFRGPEKTAPVVWEWAVSESY
jgi:hypothetical protein